MLGEGVTPPAAAHRWRRPGERRLLAGQPRAAQAVAAAVMAAGGGWRRLRRRLAADPWIRCSDIRACGVSLDLSWRDLSSGMCPGGTPCAWRMSGVWMDQFQCHCVIETLSIERLGVNGAPLTDQVN